MKWKIFNLAIDNLKTVSHKQYFHEDHNEFTGSSGKATVLLKHKCHVVKHLKTDSCYKNLLFKEEITVYSENHMKPLNTLCGNMQSFFKC